jgi:hypothetical protein
MIHKTKTFTLPKIPATIFCDTIGKSYERTITIACNKEMSLKEFESFMMTCNMAKNWLVNV